MIHRVPPVVVGGVAHEGADVAGACRIGPPEAQRGGVASEVDFIDGEEGVGDLEVRVLDRGVHILRIEIHAQAICRCPLQVEAEVAGDIALIDPTLDEAVLDPVQRH